MAAAASGSAQRSQPFAPDHSNDAGNSAAFFDVDGTLVDSTIVHYYMYFRRRLMGRVPGLTWQAWYYLKCGYFLILDRINRNRMNEVFYADYAGLSCDVVKGLADECFRDVIEPQLYPAGLACVADHQRAGRRVVFVTGSLDFIMAPLARALGVKDVIAAGMTERAGLFTGQLNGPPIGQQVKADLIRSFAQEHSIDLSASYAYGDSIADVPMLECVGHPAVVNPNAKLRTLVESRGWSVNRWTQARYVHAPVAIR